MSDISAKNVIRQTLASLERQGLEATPSIYAKEFSKISAILNFNSNESNTFNNSLTLLSEEEKELLIKNNITTFEELTPLLLQRLNNNDIKKIVELLIKSLKPSISKELDYEINKLKLQLNGSIKLITKKDIQMSIRKIIEQRITSDQKLFSSNTSDAIQLINNINGHLGDAISINQDGNLSINKLSKEIDVLHIEKTSNDDMSNIQNKLQNVTTKMSKEISENTNKLEKNKSEIDILKEQVSKLETELQTTKHENEIDHLTSTLTRKAYEKHVSFIEEKFQRAGNDYAIIFFDIDHFKKVNDTYGHEAGDFVLSTFAKVLLRSTREIDIIGRFGGEEFIGIIHHKNEKELITYITRIKSLITKHMFKYKEHKISITFSAGLTIRSKNDSYENTLSLADDLLYKAKNSGRNKIIFQSGIEV